MTSDDVRQLVESNHLYFLMYPGGSGGEFLVSLLSKYSKKFDNIWQEGINQNAETNRTSLQNSLMLDSFAFHRLNRPNSTEDDFFNRTAEIWSGINNIVEIKKSVEGLIKNKKVLLRTHLTSCPFFNKNNTWGILIDSENGFEYANALRYIKVYCNIKTPVELEHHYLMVEPSEINRNRIIEFTNFLKNKNISAVEEIKYASLTFDSIYNNISFEELLSLPPSEIFRLFKYVIFGTWETEKGMFGKKLFYEEMTSNINRLKFSELFQSGYLENIFEVTDIRFRNELLNWHNRNLQLIKNHGL